MILKNKKGDEQIISIWMIFIWVVITAGIVTGAWLFYNSKADVRDYEIVMLNNRIVDCLNNVDFNKPGFDLFTDCRIDKKLIDESEKYYVKLTIDNKIYEYGVANFVNLCQLNSKNPKNFPICTPENKYTIKGSNIVVFVGSNQWGAKL